jgi:lysyl-tRNA synthetase class 2
MADCETLITRVAAELGLGGVISRQGGKIGLMPPWERLTVREAFSLYAGVSVEEALITDRFDEIMTCAIEPHLGRERPVFLYEYPAMLGALARVKAEDREVAERFELYIAGMELANAFSELTDPVEQRQRFEKVSYNLRLKNGSVHPLPERFLESLSRMPASAGIALGLDRLAMIFADQTTIDAVVAFTPESL